MKIGDADTRQRKIEYFTVIVIDEDYYNFNCYLISDLCGFWEIALRI